MGAIKTVAAVGAAAWSVAAASANAQSAGNPAYQSYFNQVCLTATSQLAALCAASRGGELSGDSESSLNPNQAAVAGTTALARAQALAKVTEDRLAALREDGASQTAASPAETTGMFASVQYEDSNQDRGPFANERGYDADAWRLVVGADRRFAFGVLGVALTYTDYGSDFDANRPGNNFTPQATAGGVDSKDWNVTLYAAMAPSANSWVEISGGLGFVDYDLRRNAQFQESNRIIPQTNVQARGSANGRELHLGAGVGYDADMGALSVGPYARLHYLRSRIDAYTETGAAGLAINVPKSRTTSLVGALGLRASYAISASWGVAVPQARFEYQHEFEDDARTLATSLALDPARNLFRNTTDAPDRNAFTAGAGLLFVLPGGWTPYLDYEALIGYRDLTRHRISAGLRVAF